MIHIFLYSYVFGSTYICEKKISKIYTKNIYRFNLPDEHLERNIGYITWDFFISIIMPNWVEKFIC